VILIAGISFGGYVAIRLFGDRLGVISATRKKYDPTNFLHLNPNIKPRSAA